MESIFSSFLEINHCCRICSITKDVLLTKSVFRIFLFLNQFYLGIIQLVRTQNFPKNEHFLPPDTNIFTPWSQEGKYLFKVNNNDTTAASMKISTSVLIVNLEQVFFPNVCHIKDTLNDIWHFYFNLFHSKSRTFWFVKV